MDQQKQSEYNNLAIHYSIVVQGKEYGLFNLA